MPDVKSLAMKPEIEHLLTKDETIPKPTTSPFTYQNSRIPSTSTMNLSLPRILLPSIRSCAFGLCAMLLQSPVAQATPVFEPLQAFVLPPRNPQAKLIQGSDGNFYGTTYNGGSSDNGTVFKMTAAGAVTTLVNFNATNGKNPYAGLVQGRDGNFYGTTESGGSGQSGTVFKMTPAGTLTTLVNFTFSFTSGIGYSPRDGLVQGSDGNFYGTTPKSGGSNYGTIFKMTRAGTLTTLVSFTGTNGIGASRLIQGSDGNFYGTTSSTVFKVTPAGTLTTLVNFTGTNGTSPQGGLVQGRDGKFYGTTSNGGSSNYGTVFKVSAAGALTTLVNFNANMGRYPKAGLVLGSDGNFYGTTSGGGISGTGAVFKMTPAGVMTSLVDFTGTDGNSLPTELVQGNDGNFFGTTYRGGIGDNGTVFKMTPTGALTTLVNFAPTHGSYPRAKLVQADDGNFYGTTTGTVSQSASSSTGGTVFKMTPAGVLTTLVKFNPSFYSFNQAGLTQGSDGNLYGTTPGGGSNGEGTVFRMTTTGALTTLVNFDYITNVITGSYPQAGLVQGSDDNLYGTTYAGGKIIMGTIYSNYGTIFKMTPAGAMTTLVSFIGTNGSELNSGLVQGIDGNFYGTAPFGGTSSSRDGTVFKMTPAGALTILVNFTGTNGSGPQASMVQARNGNFYGTTSSGGSSSGGTVFKMTPAGALTTLVNFDSTNGWFPIAGLVQGSDGNFYGTTGGGGSGNYGTVFKMTPAGGLTTLVVFNGTNGSLPNALVQGSDGNLYGVTSEGGSTRDGQFAGGGQIFRLRMGPTVTTGVPSLITAASARLKATVNPGGYSTPVNFQYGTSRKLRKFSTLKGRTLAAGTSRISVKATATGLLPNTTYYNRAVASNAENTVPRSGKIRKFTTARQIPPPFPPTRGD